MIWARGKVKQSEVMQRKHYLYRRLALHSSAGNPNKDLQPSVIQ